MTGPIPPPSLGRDHPPAFADSATCRDWLNHLPLVNPPQAQAQLLSQLNLLNGYALPARERLRILELLRDPVRFTLDACASRFAGRPLPLAAGERAMFDANRRLAQALALGYQHCLDACVANAADTEGHAALVAERLFTALVCEQFDHYRAGVALPKDFWRRLHGVYSTAEALAAAQRPVPDKRADGRATSAQAVYVSVLLSHAASLYDLPLKQLSTLIRWLQHWSVVVPVGASPPPNPKFPPLVADLASEAPATFHAPDGGKSRWLDVTALAGKLKRRMHALKQGATPEAVHLGTECSGEVAQSLLRHAYEHCCKGGIPRANVRRPASGECRVVASVEAIHYYLSGKPFPRLEAKLSKREVDEIATFGRVATRHDEDFSREQGYRVESWRLMDESPEGIHLQHRAPGAVRIARGQLLALMPPGSRSFLLAGTRWIMMVEDDEVRVGVRLLPGVAQPVALRPAGPAHARDLWRPGFLLEAVAALGAPQSVVLPVGLFRPERMVEIAGAQAVKLARLIERGSDYERVEVRSG